MNNDERDQKITETHTLVLGMEKSISTLFKAIEGNGQPGLKQEVAVLKASHAAMIERARTAPAVQGNKIAITALVMSVLVSPLISFLLAMIIKQWGI